MMNEEFNTYMNNFKALSLNEKHSILIEQLKVLSALTNTMCKEIGSDNEVIINRELLDLNKTDYTEDDFVEAAITYTCSIQNSICDYIDGIEKKLDDLENKLNLNEMNN